MIRRVVVLGLLVVAITTITANAATVSVGDSQLDALVIPADIDVPPGSPGDVDCDIDWYRHPFAQLEWEAVDGAEGYEIEHRGPFSSGYRDLASVGGGTTELALKPSFLRHQYRVSAVVGGAPGEPAESPRVHCRPKFTYFLGGHLTGSEHHSIRYATLDWPDDDVSVGYVVLRSRSSGGPYEIVGAPLGSEFVDSPIEDGVTFYYRVVGIDASGMESEPSNEVEIADQTVGTSEDSGAEPSATAEPTATTEPAATPEPTGTPEPAVPPEPTGTPQSTATPEPAATPEPTSTPEPTPEATPEPTAGPGASATPEPTPEPTPTPDPTPETTVEPTPEATPA